MSLIQTFPDGGGGANIPNGSTVTPTDDISIWLKCAGLHQSYTTLNEVLADSGVLSALMANTNAVDYLVRSTTWATTICANETAMDTIGVNDYCAEILLSDSTWGAAIGNSTYWEEVLSPLVPIKSSSDQSGVSADAYYSASMMPYKAFDGDTTTMWTSTVKASTTSGAWIQYDFGQPVKVYKSKAMPEFTVGGSGDDLNGAKKYYIAASNDNITFTPISEEVTTRNVLEWSEVSFTCNEAYRYWRCQITETVGAVTSIAPSLRELQFYGRGELSSKDYIEQNITLSTTATTTATFISSKIKSDSVIEVFAGRSTGDVQGAKNQFPYDSVYTTNGSCVVTFPAESSAIIITVRIYIRG